MVIVAVSKFTLYQREESKSRFKKIENLRLKTVPKKLCNEKLTESNNIINDF